MVRFNYKGGCGVREHTRIEVLKKEQLAWVTDKWLGLLIIQCYLKH